MKRLFTFLFALLSACTFSAYAEIVDGTCGDNLTWTLNTEDGTLVIAGEGEMKDYNQIIEFAPWSDYKSYIKYVTLPDGLTSIGYGAFDGCSGLTSVTIPNSVTSIGGYAFRACSGLTSVTIPDSVMSIGNEAFYDCYKLTSNTIPNSVTSIGERAFYECSDLTSVTIGNSVKSIGNEAFYDCSRLTSVTIGNSVTSIGGGAFDGCYSLTSVTIPNSVKSIGSDAFYGCFSLTSVTFGSGVTSIGYQAFGGCSKIQEVTAYMPIPLPPVTCGLNNTSCTLYVPAEYLEVYQNAAWWKNFKEIRAIDADHVVTFYDWDGTILATMKVPDGEAATAPADPTREGYTFIGWDKDFSNITADLDVHAQYEAGADKEFEVIFNDQDNNELSAQSVTLRVPLAPEIEGFTFLYWKTIDARIDDVIIIQAVYESNSPTEAPEVFVNPANPAQKLIRNGQVYILHEEKMYTISGQVVK